MNRPERLTDDVIEAAFEQRARQPQPDDLRDDILTRIGATRQTASWRLRLAISMPRSTSRPAWIGLLVVAGILGIALAIALAIASQLQTAPLKTGLLAFVRDGDVYLANPDGSGAVRVVHDDGVAFSAPLWAPDGRTLALHGGGALFVLDPQTLRLHRVAVAQDAVWSADGSSIAFVAASVGNDVITGGNDVIDVVRVDTGVARQLRPKLGQGTALGTQLAWSPDGRWFLASTNPTNCQYGCSPLDAGLGFVRIDAATGDAVQIATMPHLSEPGAHWSPDSQAFAYARPDQSCDGPPCSSTIVVEAADLSHELALTDPMRYSSSPVWSPDGTWIAFESAGLKGSSSAPTDVAPGLSIVRPDGRDLRSLVEDKGAIPRISSFSWSADGTALTFARTDHSTGTVVGVFEVQLRDAAVRAVATSPVWDGFDWQMMAAGQPIAKVPEAPPPIGGALASIPPLTSPPSAAPADPSRSWSGLAMDGYCDAGILNFHTLTPQYVGSRCSTSDGTIVFAPRGTRYAVSGNDGSVTVVTRGGSAVTVVAAKPVSSGNGPGNGLDWEIAWSPDGHWLAANRCADDAAGNCAAPEHLVLGADGRSKHVLPGPASWSPDGRVLAVNAANGDLLIGPPDGSDLRSIGVFPMPSSWSPDATHFAFIRNGDVWVANSDGTSVRDLTDFANGGAYGASWSPDGRFIAVTQDSRLVILQPTDGAVRPVDLGPGRSGFYNVDWSPDTTRLLVEVSKGDQPATLLVRTDDWMAVVLDRSGLETSSWSPDGRYIAFMETTSPTRAVDVTNGDGSGRHTVSSVADGTSGRMTWVP